MANTAIFTADELTVRNFGKVEIERIGGAVDDGVGIDNNIVVAWAACRSGVITLSEFDEIATG